VNIKVGTLLASPVVLQRLASEQISQVRTAYRLSRLLKAISEEAETADKQRIALWKKYGEETDGVYRVKSESARPFQDEMKSLAETEIVTELVPLKASELQTAGVTLSAADVITLGELFDFDMEN